MVSIFSISLLCPWLCANMGDHQLSWCRYMCNRGEAAESEVHIGAEGLTGCVNRAWLPWELMAIDHPRPQNDRSYLELALAMWDMAMCVSMYNTYSVFKLLCSNVSRRGFRLSAGRHGGNIHVAHNATVWVTHHHQLVRAIIVIDCCVSSCCSSPLCQLRKQKFICCV